MSDDHKSKREQEDLQSLLDDQQLLELLEKEWQENPNLTDMDKQRLQHNWQKLQKKLPKKRSDNKLYWMIGLAAAALLFFVVLPRPIEKDPILSPTFKSGESNYHSAEGLNLQWLKNDSIIVSSTEDMGPETIVLLFIGDEVQGELLWSGKFAELPQTLKIDPSSWNLDHVRVCALLASTIKEEQNLILVTLENWQVLHHDNCIERSHP